MKYVYSGHIHDKQAKFISVNEIICEIERSISIWICAMLFKHNNNQNNDDRFEKFKFQICGEFKYDTWHNLTFPMTSQNDTDS